MSLLILYLPLLGAVISGFFGYIIGRAGSFFISTGALAVSLFFSIYFLSDVFFYYDIEYLNLGPWIHSGLFCID
jgi:NADH:ubiquinone oxidoreductase subunit 5 (subunit L)/multisubunit Na+/H+ antiporter MnhA subunit